MSLAFPEGGELEIDDRHQPLADELPGLGQRALYLVQPESNPEPADKVKNMSTKGEEADMASAEEEPSPLTAEEELIEYGERLSAMSPKQLKEELSRIIIEREEAFDANKMREMDELDFLMSRVLGVIEANSEPIDVTWEKY